MTKCADNDTTCLNTFVTDESDSDITVDGA